MSLGEGKIRLVGGSTSTITIGASNSITLSDDGSDRFMAIGKSNFTQFDQSTAGLILGTDNGTTKFELAANASNYISFNGSAFDIKTETFKLDTTKLDIDSSTARIEVLTSGSVSYQSDWSSGVDGWVTGAEHAGNQDSVTDGSTTKNNVYRIMIQDGNLVAPHSYRNVSVTSGESYTISLTYLIPDAGSTGGANSGVNGFRFAINDSTDKGLGTYDDGVVGTWTTVEHTLTAASSTLQIRIYPTDDVSFTYSSGGIHVGDRIYISNMTVTPNRVRVRIGEVDSTAADHFGLVIFDGTGTSASDEIVHFSDAKNQIASWSLSTTQITSNNLVIDSSGTIQSSDFASNVKGWRISAANNGEAEFENIRIRGTLSTAVFEKETVNAVGGQLYIANSTALTGSSTLAATATTMSVVNVSGFSANEILSAKKVGSTGFATEYMLVESASRDVPSSETDFSGKLYVVRGYQSGSAGSSGSLGDSSNISQSFEPGQVIVSTGVSGSGFIRLNANPNDTTTPYIDIVERTGSGVYDVALKARLGDLSGLSSGLLFGNASPGFGLFTENVFLQGAITATTGSFTGIVHIKTDNSNQIKLGTNVNNSLDGIYVNNNNFWYTNGHFRTGVEGDGNNFIHQSGSSLTIKSETFDLKGGTTLILENTTPKLVLGTNASSITATNNTGVYMDGAGNFRVGEDQGSGDNFIYFNGTTIQMKSTVFDLVAGSTLVINSSTPKIALGNSATGQDLTTGTGIFMNGSGHFRAGKAGHGRIEWDGTNLIISSSKFLLGDSNTQFISGSGGSLEISSSAFHLNPNTNTMKISGSVVASEGTIGGWNLTTSTLANGSNIVLDSTNKRISINDATFGNDGLQMEHTTGGAKFYVGDGSTKFFKFDGTNVDIQTEKFNASGSQILLGAPSFRLGSTGNFISGSGGSLVIQSSGTTTLSGSAVNILTPSFFMGATGSAFVSGSGGKLEISSSKFHIKSSGDVIVRKISATDGTIGQFNIGTNTLSATNFELNPGNSSM